MPMAPNTSTLRRIGSSGPLSTRPDTKNLYPSDSRSSSAATTPTPTPAPLSHRVRSMPMLKVTHSESALISGLMAASPAPAFDRELFQRLDEVNTELARIQRLSAELPQNREMEHMQAELRRMQHHSRRAVQQQKDLMDKIDRQEQSALRRYFAFGKEQKVETLRAKLWERMSESVDVDTQLQRLERQNGSLLEARQTMANATTSGSGYLSSGSVSPAAPDDQEAVELAVQIEALEHERDDLIASLINSVHAPEAQQLHGRIAMYVSEIHACESILKQVDKCSSMYRQALLLLQSALATMNLPEYSGQLKEFVTGPYFQAVDAGHIMETAAYVVQPEARRRYRERAPELLNVRQPKFPQSIVDFAKRARVNYDRKSSLSLEASRKLRAGESVVVLMHRIAIQKLQVLNQWREDVEQDLKRSRTAHDRLAARLQEKMLVMSRSASA